MGKGRQIAALIRQHHHEGGRRTLWVSVSTDLRYDAVRDLKDVDAANIVVHPRASRTPRAAPQAHAPQALLPM